MMVGVLVVLAFGAILVNRRDDSQVIATADVVPSSAPTDRSVAETVVVETTTNSRTTTQDTSSASSTQTQAPEAPPSSDLNVTVTTAAPNSTVAATSPPPNTTTAAETSTSTSGAPTTSTPSNTTSDSVSRTTSTSDVNAQATTSTSEPVATSTTATTNSQPDPPVSPNPLTADVASGTYALPTSGSVTIILPKGTADPSLSGPLLLIRITSLVDTNDERWELRSNGAGIGMVTARTDAAVIMWTIIAPTPGY